MFAHTWSVWWCICCRVVPCCVYVGGTQQHIQQCFFVFSLFLLHFICFKYFGTCNMYNYKWMCSFCCLIWFACYDCCCCCCRFAQRTNSRSGKSKMHLMSTPTIRLSILYFVCGYSKLYVRAVVVVVRVPFMVCVWVFFFVYRSACYNRTNHIGVCMTANRHSLSLAIITSIYARPF